MVCGPGTMLGLDDIASLQNHSYSVKCVTPTGTILKIDLDRFYGVIKHIPDGFSQITNLNKVILKKFIDKLTLIEEQNE